MPHLHLVSVLMNGKAGQRPKNRTPTKETTGNRPEDDSVRDSDVCISSFFTDVNSGIKGTCPMFRIIVGVHQMTHSPTAHSGVKKLRINAKPSGQPETEGHCSQWICTKNDTIYHFRNHWRQTQRCFEIRHVWLRVPQWWWQSRAWSRWTI